jgi:hypothetical protein
MGRPLLRQVGYCSHCQTEISITPAEWRKRSARAAGMVYCSHRCANVARNARRIGTSRTFAPYPVEAAALYIDNDAK